MANGEKPRKHNNSLQNAGQLQGFENLFEDTLLNKAVSDLRTNLTNEQRFEEYSLQNELYNFQMQKEIEAYKRSLESYGLNQQAIDMEVAYQQQQIYSDADARLQELAYLQQDLDFSFAEETIKSSFATANNSLALKINAEEAEKRNRQFGAEMRARSIEQTEAKAEGRRNLLKQTLETQREAGNAAASGRRGQSARLTKQSIESVAAIDHYSLYSQLQRGEGAFQNITSNIAAQKKSDDFIGKRQRDKLLNDKDELAQLFGLTVEQYEADTEKLGRMMIDTYAGIQSQLDRLAKDEFRSRVELFSRMPMEPMMPPRAKPPREIPKDKFTLPSKPIFMDHKTMASMPKQEKPSGFQSFLGIGSAVLGIGATVLGAIGAPTIGPLAVPLLKGGSALMGLGARL